MDMRVDMLKNLIRLKRNIITYLPRFPLKLPKKYFMNKAYRL